MTLRPLDALEKFEFLSGLVEEAIDTNKYRILKLVFGISRKLPESFFREHKSEFAILWSDMHFNCWDVWENVS